MKTNRLSFFLGLAGLGLVLATQTGCQTNVGGMTLPSPYYLQHSPQFIPPSPGFPLSRELATMETQQAGAVPGARPAP